MRFLSLFAGIGGFDLGLERAGMECVGQVENDPYCIKVLEKHWPDVSRWGDIRDVTEEVLADAECLQGYGRDARSMAKAAGRKKGKEPKTGRPSSISGNGSKGGNQPKGEAADRPIIDVLTGGYPCQPFSNAGKRRGAEDDRHLWPEMHRLVASIRPTWVIAENVAGHINMGLDQVLSDLEGEGYACWPLVIPACAVDAPHRRNRVWIIAHSGHTEPSERGEPASDHQGRSGERIPTRRKPSSSCPSVADASHKRNSGTDDNGKRKKTDKKVRVSRELGGSGGDVPNTGGLRLQGGQKPGSNKGNGAEPINEQLTGSYWGNGPSGEGKTCWLPEPPVGRVAHGIPSRVDRLRALGNAVVPRIPEIIGRAIIEAEKEKP